jgi:hypothetical protein
MALMLFFALWLLMGADAPPGVVIDHQAAVTRQYIGSPSIAILADGSYVASHDYFGAGSTQSTSAVSRVFRSTDRGATWRQTAELRDQFWSNLFVHRGRLYLMGTTSEYGRVVIRASQDGGATWTDASYLTSDSNYHTAPVPVAVHRGQIWRAMEYHPPGPWGFFEALMFSAPAKADLLDPKSWQISERLPYPVDATPGKHWLEGNAVVAPDGSLLDILRVDNVEKAALVRVHGSKLEFIGLTDFPGGAKKFTIRYDRKTRRYWALANPAPDVEKPAAFRNKLSLISSRDLRDWRVERVVVSHPDALKHGFQYVDWQFDGKDLAAVVRVAFDDENGGAHNFHDANYLTFLRVPDFRSRK